MGVELAARGGYDPRAAISLWQKMAKASSGGPPQWLSTHPSNETRQGPRQYAPRVMPLYEQATQRAEGCEIIKFFRPSTPFRTFAHASANALRKTVVEPRGATSRDDGTALIYRPPPGPRSHQPAGLRRPRLAGRKPGASWIPSSPRPTTTRRPTTGTWASSIRSRASRSKPSTFEHPRGRALAFPVQDAVQGIVHVIGPRTAPRCRA